MKKEDLRIKEKEYKQKVKEYPKSSFWKKQLENIRKQLYGHK